MGLSIKRKGKGKFANIEEIREEVKALPSMCQHKWNFREKIVDIVHKQWRSTYWGAGPTTFGSKRALQAWAPPVM